MLPAAIHRDSDSAEFRQIQNYLSQRYLVTLLCTTYPKNSAEVLYEHQFLEVFLRSGFEIDGWKRKYLSSAVRSDFFVFDFVRDSLSRPLADEFIRLGARAAAE